MANKTYNLLIPATKAIDNGDGTWSIAVADLVGQDGLQSIQLEHRIGRSLDGFFNTRIFGFDGNPLSHRGSTDDMWTDDGLVIPEGDPAVTCGAAIYSRRVFKYPSLSTYTKLPDELVRNWYIGFESGSQGTTGIFCLRSSTPGFTYIGGGVRSSLFWARVDSLLPADILTAEYDYLLKINKHTCEFFVDGVLLSVMLMGLQEAIPTWENNDPYTLHSTPVCIAVEISTLLEIYAAGGDVTFPLAITPNLNDFVASDGDPMPPRQYAMYKESTDTQWTGLATGGNLQTSHPVPVWGYERKTLHFMATGAGTLTVQIYSGGGWRDLATPAVAANTFLTYDLAVETPIVRCTYDPSNGDTITLAEWYLS